MRSTWQACGGTLVLTAAVALLLVYSLGLSRIAARIPQFALVAALLLLLMQCARQVRAARSSSGSRRGEASASSSALTPAAATAWLTGHALAVALLGVIMGPGLFSVAYLRYRSRETWPMSLAFGTVLTASLYAVLQLVLAADPYGGLVRSLKFPGS
jgi:hypothetical protein